MFATTIRSAVAAALCLALAVPALAADRDNNAKAAASAQALVDQSAGSIQSLRADNADFTDLLKKAKGVFIVPNLVKGAAVVGGSGGNGVLVVRHGGGWSGPAFFTIGSISIGAQAGAQAGPMVMFLMTDKAVSDFTQADNFSLNGAAGLTVNKFSKETRASLPGNSDIVLWWGAKGLFAGADVSGSDIIANLKEDRAFYNGGQIGTKEIIENKVNNAQADKLLKVLPS